MLWDPKDDRRFPDQEMEYNSNSLELTYLFMASMYLFIHFYQHNFYKKTPDGINYSDAGILSLDSPDCCLSGKGRGLPFTNGNGIFI